MRSITVCTILGTVLVLASSTVAQTTPSDCVANALATTDPNNAVADAVSNAIAQGFSKVISCGDGTSPNPETSSNLAIAVAVAISESRVPGEQCTATADAAAEEVANQVADVVGDGLVNGAPSPTEKGLADAWMNKKKGELAMKVKQGEMDYKGEAADEKGCVNFSAILGSAPTAADVGNALSGAITEILTAVTCGTNVVNTPGEPCEYDGANFVGDCVDDPPPANTATKKKTGLRKFA